MEKLDKICGHRISFRSLLFEKKISSFLSPHTNQAFKPLHLIQKKFWQRGEIRTSTSLEKQVFWWSRLYIPHNIADQLWAWYAPPPPTVMPVVTKTGRPLTSIPEYPLSRDSDHSDTDPETLLTEEATVTMLVLGTGEAIPRVCLVCKTNLSSRMALFHHMRADHPGKKPYRCDDCQHQFNNLKELSSHRSNIHRRRKVSCNQWAYKTTTKAKMWQHMRVHTGGVPCPHSFPTLSDMLCYDHLHDERQTFECSDCDAVYHTLNSLRIHQIGKYGEGYICEMCDRRFDMPVQHARHQKKCESL